MNRPPKPDQTMQLGARIDELKTENKRLREVLEQIGATATKMASKCYEGSGMGLMKSRAISIEVKVKQTLKPETTESNN